MRRTLFLFALASGILFLGLARTVKGYALEGPSWPAGSTGTPTTITMNLQLSSATYAYPGGGLQDGSASWNAVAAAALGEWNLYLSEVQFASNTNTNVTPAQGDGVNSVIFSSSAFGQGFGADAIAVTLSFYHVSSNKFAEADVVVNTAEIWDSYRGPLLHSIGGTYHYDLRRVLDHEFGHVLGLNHPDLATPVQNVTAIMNSTVGDLDHIEQDDVDGAMFLYGQKTVLAPVTVTATPAGSGTVTGGGSYNIGSILQLMATPASYYEFVQWEDGSTSPNRSITVPVQGGAYTATFRLTFEDWTSGSSSSTINAMIFANNQFYAFATGTTFTSPDASTWTVHASNLSGAIYPGNVAYGNGIFVDVSGSSVYTSTDGFSWTASSTLPNGGGMVTYGNGIFVAPGSVASGVPTPMYVSSDGVTWTSHPGPVGYGLNAIIYGNGLFVSIGYQNNVGNISAVSPDGTTWTTSAFPYVNLRSMAYGKGVFVAAGVGHVVESTDGLTWQTDSFPNSSSYIGDIDTVSYGSGFFIASSTYETIFSTDAVNWTLQPSTVSNGVNIVYGNGRFVGYSSQGFVQSGAVLPLAGAPALPVVNSASGVRSLPSAPVSYQITAANSPSVYNATGLPAGLSVDLQTGVIAGTPSVTGTFPITLYATNDAGSGAGSLTLIIAPPPSPQTYTDWETAHHFAGATDATPRGDSVPNLLKYLCNINPQGTISGTDRGALPTVGTASGDTILTLTYRQNAASLTEVTVVVESSADMQNWSTPSGAQIVATGQYDGATGDPMMQAQVPVTSAAQFIRLSVLNVPPSP